MSGNKPKKLSAFLTKSRDITKNLFSEFNWKNFFKAIFISTFLALSVGIILAGIHLKGNTLEGLLFYARVPMSDGSTQAVNDCMRFCIPTAVHIFLTAVLISFIVVLNEKNILSYSEKPLSKRRHAQEYDDYQKPAGFRGFVEVLKDFFSDFAKIVLRFMIFFGYHFIITSLVLLIGSGIYFGNQIKAFSYFKDAMKTTEVYNEEYTNPKEQEYRFPEKKKNLIYIFLESMESSFSSVEEGGLMEENYIPYLTELAKENVSFSDTELLGGAQSVSGTTWTAAAMVTQTSGIPLTIPLSKPNFGKDDTFLPGAYSIGDILEDEGYNQELMVGSIATYAKREAYFVEHGNYRIFDYYTAEEEEKIPVGYFRWWGFEDQKLFEYAKEEITELYEEGKPFNFTMLTVDTHFTDGYKCELCPADFDNQYANVIKCSDKQIYEFVEWIKQQPFYEDTVIVLAGDHLTMDHNYFNRVPTNVFQRGRRIYNCFINSDLNPDSKITQNRVFSTLDMFPTTLAAMGVTWGKDSLGLGVNLFSGTETLAEKKGIDGLSDELASSSSFYGDYIIDYNQPELPPNNYGEEEDIEYAEKYREDELKRQNGETGVSAGVNN